MRRYGEAERHLAQAVVLEPDAGVRLALESVRGAPAR